MDLFGRIPQVARDFAGSAIQDAGVANIKAMAETALAQADGFMKGVRSRGLPGVSNAGGNGELSAKSSARFRQDVESTDWRVKISLPTSFNFLSSPVLRPLLYTGGKLVFPFTPTIIVSHSANYNPIHPVHSNYAFFAYENSQVDALTITGTFVQQNALEAQYWVAMMHFLRSASKMAYGDTGSPPPVLRLNGYGDYVFNDVPVILTNFTVDLPGEVDYIATNLPSNEFGSSEPTSGISYAPVESQVTVTLQPAYSRSQVESFSLSNFVNGNYLASGQGFI